ncbi:unnamed protein product, partial [Symbiodinium necroappetens]
MDGDDSWDVALRPPGPPISTKRDEVEPASMRRHLCCMLLWDCLVTNGWERDLAEEILTRGLTSARFKKDVMQFFRSEKYSSRAALDIGAGEGTTTAALAVNFAVVVAVEKYWNSSWSGGLRLDSNRLLKRDGSKITNIVRLHVDTLLSGSFAPLAHQNFSAAVIDADHGATGVMRDTFNILRGLPCCVETIIYHDYCDEIVYAVVNEFVQAGLLTFRSAMGEPKWHYWWCKDDRPEGAAMKVLWNPFHEFQERLERLYRQFVGWEGSMQETLNGSTWLLLPAAASQMFVLKIGFWPSMSYVSSVTSDFDHINVNGPAAGKLRAFRAGYAEVVPWDMPFLSIVAKHGGRRHVLWAELDRDLSLLRLHAPTDHPVRCHPGCMGISFRQRVSWAKQIDHLLNVDERLVAAAKEPRHHIASTQFNRLYALGTDAGTAGTATASQSMGVGASSDSDVRDDHAAASRVHHLLSDAEYFQQAFAEVWHHSGGSNKASKGEFMQ